jgi:hypothetical protein
MEQAFNLNQRILIQNNNNNNIITSSVGKNLSKNLALNDKKEVYKSKIPKFIKKINLTSIT